MKKCFLIAALLLVSCLAAKAQDHIILRNGSNISARVLEVSPEFVKYKKISNPNGPVYTTYTADIESIVYENGSVEEFTPEPLDDGRRGADHKITEQEQPYPDTEPYVEEEVPMRIDFIEPGAISYESIRKDYEGKVYYPSYEDPFSPFGSGLASLLLPGLGQFFDGEVGRGFAIIGGNLGFYAVEALEITGLVYSASGFINQEYYKSTTGVVLCSGALALTALGQFAFYIWNICDAARIAEVKNMYYRDVKMREYALDMHLAPQLAFAPSAGNSIQPVAGLSLKVCF